MSASEFQVVLLAGGAGNRLYPLTEENSKVCLPIANRPLLSYQIEFLERAGINDVIVVTTLDTMKEIKEKFPEKMQSGDKIGKVRVSYEVVKPGFGTAEVLLKIKDKIQKDFIVMSADVIVTENFFPQLTDIHRTRDAAVTMLLKKNVKPELPPTAKKEKTEEQPTDFVGVNDQGRVLFFSSAADLEEQLSLTKSLLRSYPNFTIYKNLLDAHFYIFSRWTLDVLDKYEKQITSIKGEFIPFLAKLQIRKKLKKGGLPDSLLGSTSVGSSMSSARVSEKDRLGCFAYIMNADEGFCIRVNTVQNFLEANREVPRNVTSFLPWEQAGKNNYIDETSQVDPKTQVGPECVVGAGTKIGERCGVKKSNVGKHCNIGNNVKIVNSVIMDYVTIKDKCTVQNSIICSNVHMEENCTLNNCQVGVGYSFDQSSTHKNESIVADDLGSESPQL